MTSRALRAGGLALTGTLILWTGTLAGGTGGAAGSAQRGQPVPLPQLMRVKLEHAEGILRALVTEDFAALERHAAQMGDLAKQPEWGVLKTPEYLRHSADFLSAADALAASARARDLNGATLDYARLTIQCVQCHRHVRGVRKAE